MKYQAQAIWNNSSNSHRLGAGGGGGGGGVQGEAMQDEDTTVWKEGERSFMEAQKGKKILFEKGI